MKVLLIDQVARINWKYSFSLANSLKDNGNDVEIIIDDFKNNGYCKCKVHNVFMNSTKGMSRVKKMFIYLHSWKYIKKYLKANNFDVLHVQWISFSPIDFYFINKIKRHNKKLKFVLTVHDIMPFNEKKYSKYYHHKIYDIADKIILQAKTNVQRFNDLFPEFLYKTTFIPHGHYLDFAESKPQKDCRKKLGLPLDKKIVLFFGQIKKVKGVDLLLESFGYLLTKRDDIMLVIAGKVWKDDFSYYEEIINKYEFNDQNLRLDIKFIPDDMIEYYFNSADLCVLPYKDIYQSGVVHLTYAYNKPVVVSNLAPFKEIVNDETGYMFESENVDSLKKVLDYALNDSKNYRSLVLKGRDIIEEKYSWDKIGAQITELYKF